MRPERGSRHCRHHYSRVPRKAPAPNRPLVLFIRMGPRAPMLCGFPQTAIDRYLVSRYSSMPWRDPSRP